MDEEEQGEPKKDRKKEREEEGVLWRLSSFFCLVYRVLCSVDHLTDDGHGRRQARAPDSVRTGKPATYIVEWVAWQSEWVKWPLLNFLELGHRRRGHGDGDLWLAAERTPTESRDI